MEPRLTSSKKWTSFPKELLTQVQGAFAQSFKTQSKTGEFILDGRIYSKEIMLCVGYLEKGRLRQINFDSSVDFDAKKTNALKIIHLCVDCCASLFQQYFESEDTSEFPVEWQLFEVEDNKVYIRFHATNSSLEEQADQLLGMDSDEGLLVGEDEEEIKNQLQAMLGISEDDDEVQ